MTGRPGEKMLKPAVCTPRSQRSGRWVCGMMAVHCSIWFQRSCHWYVLPRPGLTPTPLTDTPSIHDPGSLRLVCVGVRSWVTDTEGPARPDGNELLGTEGKCVLLRARRPVLPSRQRHGQPSAIVSGQVSVGGLWVRRPSLPPPSYRCVPGSRGGAPRGQRG